PTTLPEPINSHATKRSRSAFGWQRIGGSGSRLVLSRGALRRARRLRGAGLAGGVVPEKHSYLQQRRQAGDGSGGPHPCDLRVRLGARLPPTVLRRREVYA